MKRWFFPLLFLSLLGWSLPASADICGPQGLDNRPNHCLKADGSHGVSSCRRIAPGQCEYTHCSGATRMVNDPLCCCVTHHSTLCTHNPKPRYVALCLGVTATGADVISIDDVIENPGGLPAPKVNLPLDQEGNKTANLLNPTTFAIILMGVVLILIALRRRKKSE